MEELESWKPNCQASIIRGLKKEAWRTRLTASSKFLYVSISLRVRYSLAPRAVSREKLWAKRRRPTFSNTWQLIFLQMSPAQTLMSRQGTVRASGRLLSQSLAFQNRAEFRRLRRSYTLIVLIKRKTVSPLSLSHCKEEAPVWPCSLISPLSVRRCCWVKNHRETPLPYLARSRSSIRPTKKNEGIGKKRPWNNQSSIDSRLI